MTLCLEQNTILLNEIIEYVVQFILLNYYLFSFLERNKFSVITSNTL